MTLGVIMLVHANFHRVREVVRHWVDGNCPIVIHVDKRVKRGAYDKLVADLSDLEHVHFSKRYRCEWGTWGITAATQDCARQILDLYPDLRHVYLASGSCLPLRPVSELVAYLQGHLKTDFIESSTIADVPWTVGGLEKERFSLWFPVAWRKNRWLFDRLVDLQRRLRVKRRIPARIEPHMGSQWWCLSRRTLMAILDDPDKRSYDSYFRHVWIPDESYFQTLARLHSRRIESRSLTLSKFDYQGKPHIFYADHKMLLMRSGCFVARKIWHGADFLYESFPVARNKKPIMLEPNPSAADQVFANAVNRRTLGRPGLVMQSRFPATERDRETTAGPFSVLCGFSDVFNGFEAWLAKSTDADVHGHLFAPDRVKFQHRHKVHKGSLSNFAAIRDYNPEQFLTSLIWNARSTHQGFQFSPRDQQAVAWKIAKDPNARISVVTGAWVLPLLRSDAPFIEIRKRAADLQRIEREFVDIMRSPYTLARVRIQTLASFVQSPKETLQTIVDEMSASPRERISELPEMVSLKGLGLFLQSLRNEGMHPQMTGEFPTDDEVIRKRPPKRKTNVVRKNV